MTHERSVTAINLRREQRLQALLRLLLVMLLIGSSCLFSRSLANGFGRQESDASEAQQSPNGGVVGHACQEQLTAQQGPIYRGDQGISPARAIHTPDPKYPKSARKTKKQGAVVLCLIVSAEGNVSDVKVSRSVSPDLDETAVSTVKSWTFAPATKGGKPVASQVWTTVWFKIRG